MAFLDRAQDVACLVMVALGEVDLKDVRLVSLLNWVIYLELSAMSEMQRVKTLLSFAKGSVISLCKVSFVFISFPIHVE